MDKRSGVSQRLPISTLELVVSNAERRALLAKMENRLLIGSAVTAPYSQPDWQEGAVAAAWQALTSLHQRAMRGDAL